MSATTPSRLGLVNNTGTDYTALFLKQFAGEVLTTFETSNVFKALHTVRTISQGKSAQFPVTGIASASYHVAGENILDSGNSYLSQIKHAEKVINIDSMLTANTMIYELDEAMNHYDVRSIYTTELGRALALKFDKTIAQVLALSARGSSLIGGNGGTVLAKGASGLDTGTEIADAIYDAAQALDEKDVPAEDRFCAMKPAEYYLLVQHLAAVGNANAVGSYVEGDVVKVAGMRVVPSNNVPSTDIGSAETGVSSGNTYHGDFSNTKILCWQKSAIGTVKLLDLKLESERKIEFQGSLFVARYAMGHGVLRPEASVEITVA
mgnify:CR=1 FL=1|tara:strand:+ start:2119 stop:3081 length:963 start_codon:yes stop_codon:yes gene_type:complete